MIVEMKRYLLPLLLLISYLSYGQQLPDEYLRKTLGSSLSEIYKEVMLRSGSITVDSISLNAKKKSFDCYAGVSLAYIPMREETVRRIYDSVRYYLPEKERKYRISVFSDGEEISDLIPNFFRDKQKAKDRMIAHKVKTPLVTNLSSPVPSCRQGLSGNHIAMWQSHGRYYEQKLSRWEWQRARIFQTVEDLYTQSYVVPFLVPMLENAGANVLLPRERDYSRTEVIVDNDITGSGYSEENGREAWTQAIRSGFAHLKTFYTTGENPFRMGTARQVKTVSHGKESLAVWRPEIPEKGHYAVYVSYQTVQNSSDDALYTVHHAGGSTDFRVNQQMGGGTWIFLGQFTFDKGNGQMITLSNRSKKAGRTVTADGIKIGGGMGNIARMPGEADSDKAGPKTTDSKTTDSKKTNAQKNDSSDADSKTEEKRPEIQYRPEVSGYPRYTEGARYWMQWAGVPDSIYHRYENDDYTDDYASRGYWVNWLAGGSSVLPKEKGLRIPVDLAFAFHSDAGTFRGDRIVGTLGIYMTHHNGERFENGKSRRASRDLTELIMQEIVRDIRRNFEPEWTRRPMWNRSYAEARVPNVPTMLLELLSHQNFADMRYGLDPAFRFTVSRSIYKGMLKFLATQYNRSYVVQPLPVRDFSVRFSGDREVELTWQPVADVAEPTAVPTHYIVYTRKGTGGFDNGIRVETNRCSLSVEKDTIYGFRVEAVNEGGKSFPSETLAACRKSEQKGEVLIVNGFTRVSAPYSFTAGDSIAGFVGTIDNGVPYLADHLFIGHQHEYRRVIPWMDDDASGFGDSNADYEATGIAGNTFDYPYLHGMAFADAGYSFVSCAAAAVESGAVRLTDYRLLDWILGKQREWHIARGAKPTRYKTFSPTVQEAITAFSQAGGNIVVSGAFVGTDLWDNPGATDNDRKWAKETLRFKWRNNYGAVTGAIKAVASPYPSIEGNYNYYNRLNSESYVVENPDAIEPADKNGVTIFRYSENNLSAGILYKGNRYGCCILGFPIESLTSQQQRNRLVKQLLKAWGL